MVRNQKKPRIGICINIEKGKEKIASEKLTDQNKCKTNVQTVLVFLFPGNCNLVYAIIRKRNLFHQLANLPSDPGSIQKALQRKKKSPDVISRTSSQETISMEGSRPAVPAEPGTLKASLVAIPGTGHHCRPPVGRLVYCDVPI